MCIYISIIQVLIYLKGEVYLANALNPNGMSAFSSYGSVFLSIASFPFSCYIYWTFAFNYWVSSKTALLKLISQVADPKRDKIVNITYLCTLVITTVILIVIAIDTKPEHS